LAQKISVVVLLINESQAPSLEDTSGRRAFRSSENDGAHARMGISVACTSYIDAAEYVPSLSSMIVGDMRCGEAELLVTQ
jgi:hypothetical protein